MHTSKDFFRAVLPVSGMPCLGWITGKGNKKFFTHKVFDSVDALVKYTENVDYTSSDYYFAISTLKNESIQIGEKKRVRVRQNISHTRCFILDVDIHDGDNKFYASIDDAIVGVEELCDALSLPSPILVNSGYGLHVYWPMAGAVEGSDWSPVARQFKAAVGIIAPLLVGDGSRVADCAGVLRVPGSWNLKHGDQKPVEIMQWTDETLDFGELKSTLDRISGPAKKVNIQTQPTVIEPVELKKVAKNCNAVKEYLRNKDKASEPEWYAMLGLVPYLKITKQDKVITGNPLAHIFSKGHEAYTVEGTDEKYRQIVENQTGPTLCERIRAVRPEYCKGCPFEEYVSTPIQTASLDKPTTKEETVTTVTKDELGNEEEETVTIPLPPEPYFRGENGGVYTRVKEKQEDGTWGTAIHKVYDYDMYPIKRVRNETTEDESMITYLWLPVDGLRKFKLPTTMLADSKTLGKFLARKGVVPQFKGINLVTKYLIDYVRYLQMEKAAEIEFSRFGWRNITSSTPTFVVSDGFIDSMSDFTSSEMPDHLATAGEAVGTYGDIENWKKGFSMYKDIPDSEPYILATMMGFAAPLLALTEYSGVLYNIVGHSGGGKSTALKAMSSIWGKPSSNHILHTDTSISIFNMIGYLSSVPVAFDEMTKMEGDAVSNFVLSFTSGRGKMRAKRDGTNQENLISWDTIVCATSNVSLYDKLAQARKGYSAEAMRIFELTVGHSNPQYKPLVDKSINLLRENYGHAGREYIKYILPRLPAIKKKIEEVMATITNKAELRVEERFWGALLACVYVGGSISSKKLGLHSYNMQELVDWCLGTSEEVRNVISSTTSDAVSCLAEFINNNLSSIVRINNNKVDLAAMHSNINAVRIRLEYKDGKPDIGFVSVASVRKYCEHNNIDPSWLRRELIDKDVIKKSNAQKRLAAGTNLPNVNLRTWEIDLTNKELTEATGDIYEGGKK